MNENMQIALIILLLINFFGLIVFCNWVMDLNARLKKLELKDWLDTVELGERVNDLQYSNKRTIN